MAVRSLPAAGGLCGKLRFTGRRPAGGGLSAIVRGTSGSEGTPRPQITRSKKDDDAASTSR